VLTATVTCCLAGPSATPATTAPAEVTTRFAVLADTHMMARRKDGLDGVRPHPNLEKAVALINAMKPLPGEVLILGDLTKEGKADQYRSYVKVLAGLKVAPIRHLLGNHDKYRAFRKVVVGGKTGPAPGGWPPARYHYAWDIGSRWRMIVLDSRRGGQVIGELRTKQLDWLKQQVRDAGDRDCLIFMHHAPIFANSGGLVSPKRFWKALADRPNVRAVFCGHLHTHAFARRGEVHVVAAPTTAWCANPAVNRGLLLVTAGKKSLKVEFIPLGDVKGAKRSVKVLTWE